MRETSPEPAQGHVDKDRKALERWLRRFRFFKLRSDVGSKRWLRRIAGVLLLIGGVLGFLPILGFWMFPLGAVLLALDVPWLRRPVRRWLVIGERRWRRWRRTR
ncbi:MAG: hypothetical protein HY060_03195 [Proteobacteria bacterium]|nr:hypothetical protein [Pseudomonadota bacterium]